MTKLFLENGKEIQEKRIYVDADDAYCLREILRNRIFRRLTVFQMNVSDDIVHLLLEGLMGVLDDEKLLAIELIWRKSLNLHTHREASTAECTVLHKYIEFLDM